MESEVKKSVQPKHKKKAMKTKENKGLTEEGFKIYSSE